MKHNVELLFLRKLHFVLVLRAHTSLHTQLLSRDVLQEFSFESERFIIRPGQADGESLKVLPELLFTHPYKVVFLEVDVKLIHQIFSH